MVLFIGGTGRSGTTILGKILSMDQDFHSIPDELRFITDPDGLISLKHALVDEWSFFNADIAVERFTNLMRSVATRYVGRYPNTGLSEFVEKSQFKLITNEFVDGLVEFKFKNNWAARSNLLRKFIVTYFNYAPFRKLLLQDSFYCQPLNEEDFFVRAGEFVNTLCHAISAKAGKGHFVDHTPYNFVHAPFLERLELNAKLIHIYRDPRDVLTSYLTKDWGSVMARNNVKWIKDTYSIWEEKKQSLPTDFYYEVSFESLIFNFEEKMDELSTFLGHKLEIDRDRIDLSKHNIGGWRKKLKKDDLALLGNSASEIIERYGYHG